MGAREGVDVQMMSQLPAWSMDPTKPPASFAKRSAASEDASAMMARKPPNWARWAASRVRACTPQPMKPTVAGDVTARYFEATAAAAPVR